MNKLISVATAIIANPGGGVPMPMRPATNGQVVTDGAKVGELSLQNESLQADIERLFMITEALWTIIKQHTDLNDDHLDNLIGEIDMRDGKPNGRRKKEERPECPACKRKAIGQHKNCLYCGATIKLDPFKKY